MIMTENSWPEGTELLHIIGHEYYHDIARIVGTKEALKKLRDAIDKAIEEGCEAITAMENDGEGYIVCIHAVKANYFDNIPFGYTDPDIIDGRDFPREMYVDEADVMSKLYPKPD